jgi:hypothetical protein
MSARRCQPSFRQVWQTRLDVEQPNEGSRQVFLAR